MIHPVSNLLTTKGNKVLLQGKDLAVTTLTKSSDLIEQWENLDIHYMSPYMTQSEACSNTCIPAKNV